MFESRHPRTVPASVAFFVGVVVLGVILFTPRDSMAQSLVAAILPSSRSVQVGRTATAFATIINTGAVTATGCSLTPITSVPAAFQYQTTDRTTNAVTGSPNTPVDVAAGASQSFVFAFTPTAPFDPTEVQLAFACINTGSPAPITAGLNTILLSASAVPTPDIVALAATLDGNGIVKLFSPAPFAVATVNVGAPGAITAIASVRGANLPITASICQTDPISGACLAPPALAVTTQINANATPTFGVFVNSSAPIPFDPANNRIVVNFADQAGVIRGATSVSVASGGAAILNIVLQGTGAGTVKSIPEGIDCSNLPSLSPPSIPVCSHPFPAPIAVGLVLTPDLNSVVGGVSGGPGCAGLSVFLTPGAVHTCTVTFNVVAADTVTWQVQGASFDDGGTVTGTFNFDTKTWVSTDWNITVAGGNTAIFPPLVYTPANSLFNAPDSFHNGRNDLVAFVITPRDPFRPRNIVLYFTHPLTDPNGTHTIGKFVPGNPSFVVDNSSAIFGNPSNECFDCNPFRVIVNGVAIPVAR